MLGGNHDVRKDSEDYVVETMDCATPWALGVESLLIVDLCVMSLQNSCQEQTHHGLQTRIVNVMSGSRPDYFWRCRPYSLQKAREGNRK